MGIIKSLLKSPSLSHLFTECLLCITTKKTDKGPVSGRAYILNRQNKQINK